MFLYRYGWEWKIARNGFHSWRTLLGRIWKWRFLRTRFFDRWKCCGCKYIVSIIFFCIPIIRKKSIRWRSTIALESLVFFRWAPTSTPVTWDSRINCSHWNGSKQISIASAVTTNKLPFLDIVLVSAGLKSMLLSYWVYSKNRCCFRSHARTVARIARPLQAGPNDERHRFERLVSVRTKRACSLHFCSGWIKRRLSKY